MMEYFWYILASVLAGVGTGLVGLSAATAASLLSAGFANRVDNRTVGLVTGVVLAVLGAALILLHYWEHIRAVPLLYGMIVCILEFLEYIFIGASALLLLRQFIEIPAHVFRKLLHLIAFTCLVEMMWADPHSSVSLNLIGLPRKLWPDLYACWLCRPLPSILYSLPSSTNLRPVPQKTKVTLCAAHSSCSDFTHS